MYIFGLHPKTLHSQNYNKEIERNIYIFWSSSLFLIFKAILLKLWNFCDKSDEGVLLLGKAHRGVGCHRNQLCH